MENEQKSIEEIDKMLEELETKKWKPEIGELYHSIDYDGNVLDISYNNDYADKAVFSIGNYFKTEEEAKFEAERLKVLEELKEFSYEFNNEEWLCRDITKYCLVYHGISNEIFIYSCVNIRRNDIYFKTEEDAKKAIEKIGEDRLKKYYFKLGK